MHSGHVAPMVTEHSGETSFYVTFGRHPKRL